MKNKFHLASTALFLAVLFSIVSCSKDKIDPAGGSRSATNAGAAGRSVPEFQQNDYDALTTGSLVLQVTPLEAKAVVTVYNDNYTSGPLGVNATEGMIRIEDLEPGQYSVLIKPINTEYLPMQIDNVEIIADTKTNLGTIILGN